MDGTRARTIATRETFRKTRIITGTGTTRIRPGFLIFFQVRILLFQEKFALIAERMVAQTKGHRSGKFIK